MNHHQANELLPCAFCGCAAGIKEIGNDHTKTRAVQVKCSNIECRVERTDKALSRGMDWLRAVAIENWNRRAPAPTSEPGARDADLACETCHGTGQTCVGTSGQESDGNGPVMEPCPECAYYGDDGATPASPAVPDTDLDQALTKRDEYHDTADKLAEAIAAHLGIDIGEHSSDNCPWQAALDALAAAPVVSSPAPVAPVNDDLLDLAHIALHSINGLSGITGGNEHD